MIKQVTRPELAEAKREIRVALRGTRRKIWGELENQIIEGRTSKTVVNLYTLGRHTRKGDYAIVPGKVLGVGTIDHELTVGALSFSESALRKMRGAKCKPMLLSDFIKKYAKKEGIKIIG